MDEALRATVRSQAFAVAPAPYLLLDTELRIQAANPAYLRATGRHPDKLTGEPVAEGSALDTGCCNECGSSARR
ncbi:PAS domain-containing protein [Kutzneria sp. 744]|uniref:PAS domain-containing protein n=1 Tax=Kutzneria sp. (strain 744) TaxID=345341 RepID=UPI0004B43E24|nr:PAS domain-containing protein [Kutzneria sp. 744]